MYESRDRRGRRQRSETLSESTRGRRRDPTKKAGLCRPAFFVLIPRTRSFAHPRGNSGQKKARLGWRAESISEETWRRQDVL
ncbi:hypothetical protein GCT19_16385 [Paraburkholderia sp. CNPSo 3155]|nr:hypothetical protein [Paraburkholderia atlantica]